MEETFRKIKAFVFDVDGVLTDGGILSTVEGELYRTFDSKDGFGFRMAYMHGYQLGIITGGKKMDDFEDFCARHSLAPEEVMYFGDDLPDIPVMKACGCGVCPQDAVDEVKEMADYISPRPGGKGCAREAIERVMKAQGEWVLDVQDYKKKF